MPIGIDIRYCPSESIVIIYISYFVSCHPKISMLRSSKYIVKVHHSTTLKAPALYIPLSIPSVYMYPLSCSSVCIKSLISSSFILLPPLFCHCFSNSWKRLTTLFSPLSFFSANHIGRIKSYLPTIFTRILYKCRLYHIC